MRSPHIHSRSLHDVFFREAKTQQSPTRARDFSGCAQGFLGLYQKGRQTEFFRVFRQKGAETEQLYFAGVFDKSARGRK